MRLLTSFLIITGFVATVDAYGQEKFDLPREVRREWRDVDFTRFLPGLEGWRYNVASRGSVAPIRSPRFRLASTLQGPGASPVVSIEINGDARAYPLSSLLWHEIVNDEVGGVPVAITFSPFTNSVRVFNRKLGDQTYTFGSSGHLRHANIVLHDIETHTWWQQFSGKAIVGAQTDATLERLPIRLENRALFAERRPDGAIMIPPPADEKVYGQTPYPGYAEETALPLLTRAARATLPEALVAKEKRLLVGSGSAATDYGITADGLPAGFQRLEAASLPLFDTPSIQDAEPTALILPAGGQQAVYSLDFAFALALLRDH